MWAKIHTGFSSDPKFGIVAHEIKQPRAIVNAIVLDLIEYASTAKERGSIANYDEEAAAFNLGIELVTLRNALSSLRNRRFISGHFIANWERYQSRGDSTNAERQKRFRDNRKADSNALVTDSNALRNIDKIREEDIVIEKNTKKESPPGFEEFFLLFPRQRRGSREKTEAAYRQALNRSSPEEILAGLKSYADSDEVRQRFAKGATAWLNDDRWKNDYSRTVNFRPEKIREIRAGATNL